MSGANAPTALPLEGVRVLELAHIVAGPSAGLMIAELGAEVIKVEDTEVGDASRNMANNGITFFAFNRNKQSVAVNLRSAEGKEIFRRLVERADVVIDNYSPGALKRLGIDYDWAQSVNSRIIYCSIKGFLPGPDESRPLLDELAQMAGGLAYVTGPPGQPLRARASIIDIGAATYGLLGVLAALYRRETTGRGDDVRAGLYETTVFWMNQQLVQAQIGVAPAPRTGSDSGIGAGMGWGVYRLFDTSDDKQVFIAVTSNKHWDALCRLMRFDDLLTDPDYSTNAKRAARRHLFIDRIVDSVGQYRYEEIAKLLRDAEVPFAPVATPLDLITERHLNEGDHLVALNVGGHEGLKVPNLPVVFRNSEHALRRQPPQLGEHTDEVLGEIGYSAGEIEAFKASGVVRKSELLLRTDGAAPPS